jgi:hypothetical protein
MGMSRRVFMSRALALGATAAGLGAYEAARQGLSLLDQHQAWQEASRPNEDFLGRHARDLDRLTLGASFAPEQFRWTRGSQQEAMAALQFALHELGITKLRLGLRWNRSVDARGSIDLRYYHRTLERCLAANADICLNPGPVRVFRWPEEHVPAFVLAGLSSKPPRDATIRLGDPLAEAALAHLESLLGRLQGDYGEDLSRRVDMVQVENEPFYELGEHRWRFSLPYLAEVARRLDAVYPEASVLVTSAGRLHLDLVRDTLVHIAAREPRFQGRLVSGFDFHFKTPLRDSFPIVRHFDQISYARPFAPSTASHIREARALGFRIEVTEGQAEPYGHMTTPGNSARDFRFMLLRLLSKVLDPNAPAVIRIWGVEELAKRFIRGEANAEHRQILELVQAINGKATRRETG